ncbi:MoaD/ThiS family protein [Proteinivorax hydrogeniformans]|uniref:MoaD/ThiS family protein n=1 Tax=Proteinivorax hydrogeniformans TaxID=1826727 RepID=A0AAU8HVK0_9FIRM
MKIEVRLFATLREGRWKKNTMTFSNGSVTPTVIAEELKIDKSDIAILLVNGRDGTLDTELSNGDVVSIFPPVGGG